MALTKEAVAQFRADAIEHNEEIKAQLRPMVEDLVNAINKVIVTANELVVFDVDNTLRIRDTLINASGQLKLNLDQIVRPLLTPPPPPPPQPAT